MRRQRITLDIVYDETSYDPPRDWTWSLLLDLPADQIDIIAASYPYYLPKDQR